MANGGRLPHSVSQPPRQTLWKKHELPPNSAQYYHFSQFCMELNELLPGMREVIAPTDSRLRPDQMAMENGDLVWPRDC